LIQRASRSARELTLVSVNMSFYYILREKQISSCHPLLTTTSQSFFD